jgi:4-hydroxybenzoate polyprenyltransferase
LGAIFWTLAFDTIYGFQDLKDDEIIGIKSTSIKFKSKPHLFLKLCYIAFFLSLLFVGWLMQFSGFYYLGLVLIGFHMFFIQIQRLVIDDSKNCLEIFKSNNLLGFIVLISLIIGKI